MDLGLTKIKRMSHKVSNMTHLVLQGWSSNYCIFSVDDFKKKSLIIAKTCKSCCSCCWFKKKKNQKNGVIKVLMWSSPNTRTPDVDKKKAIYFFFCCFWTETLFVNDLFRQTRRSSQGGMVNISKDLLWNVPHAHRSREQTSLSHKYLVYIPRYYIHIAAQFHWLARHKKMSLCDL